MLSIILLYILETLYRVILKPILSIKSTISYKDEFFVFKAKIIPFTSSGVSYVEENSILIINLFIQILKIINFIKILNRKF